MSTKNINSLLLVVGFFIVISPFLILSPSEISEKENNFAGVSDIIKNDKSSTVSLFLTGDVMLGRTVMIKSLEMDDPIYPFRKVSEKLKNADLVFINLENPVIRDCPVHEAGFTFCAPPEMLDGLTFSGVDVVNLANNHSRNYGQEGFDQTLEILQSKGIKVTGADKLLIVERGGIAFGFLGFDYTVNEPKLSDYELIENSDTKVDVLVVGVHWGVEYTNEPQEHQRVWARNMVDAGVDVISGHHPHWVQSSELTNGKPVFYSLGNFIFDQMWSEETKKGLGVELLYDGVSISEIRYHPVYMREWAQPEFVE